MTSTATTTIFFKINHSKARVSSIRDCWGSCIFGGQGISSHGSLGYWSPDLPALLSQHCSTPYCFISVSHSARTIDTSDKCWGWNSPVHQILINKFNINDSCKVLVSGVGFLVKERKSLLLSVLKISQESQGEKRRLNEQSFTFNFFFHVLSFQVYSILVQKFQPDSTSLYAVCF